LSSVLPLIILTPSSSSPTIYTTRHPSETTPEAPTMSTITTRKKKQQGNKTDKRKDSYEFNERCGKKKVKEKQATNKPGTFPIGALKDAKFSKRFSQGSSVLFELR